MGQPDDSDAAYMVLENWLAKEYPRELINFTTNRSCNLKGKDRVRKYGRQADSETPELGNEFEKMYEFWSFLKKQTNSNESDIDNSKPADNESDEMDSDTDFSTSEHAVSKMKIDTGYSVSEPQDVEMKSDTGRSDSDPANDGTESVIEHSAVKRRQTSSDSTSHHNADRRKSSAGSISHFSEDRPRKASSDFFSHVSIDRSRKSSSVSISHMSKDISRKFSSDVRTGNSVSDFSSHVSENRSGRSSSGFVSHLSEDNSRKSSSGSSSSSLMKRKIRHLEDSREKARDNFSWMVNPIDIKRFFEEYWEAKYLHIQRKNRQYYRKVFSTADLDCILGNNHLMLSKNIDVVTYVDGVRSTLKLGRSHPSTVWKKYSAGASIHFLNPQTYSNSVWRLCEGLQDAFGCFVGANVYLTPAGSQGLVPHDGDTEAFVLQLEGKKRWKVSQPRKNEKLAPPSPPRFKEEDLDDPDLDVVLEAGDLLYFPRGFLRQAIAVPDAQSLHITISCFKDNSWQDLLSKAISRALSIARNTNVIFRKGLPTNYLGYMGIVHNATDDERKEEMRSRFVQHAQYLFDKLKGILPLDAAADQMGKKLVRDALPPVLRQDQKVRTTFNGGESWVDGTVVNHVEISPDTKIKLLKANVARLLMENDEVRLYYSTENSREYHELLPEEPPYLVIDSHLASGVEFLFQSYPRYKAVSKLPLEDLTSKVGLANLLWERGIIISKDPLISGFDG